MGNPSLSLEADILYIVLNQKILKHDLPNIFFLKKKKKRDCCHLY